MKMSKLPLLSPVSIHWIVWWEMGGGSVVTAAVVGLGALSWEGRGWGLGGGCRGMAI